MDKPKTIFLLQKYKNGISYDETDRVPSNINIKEFDIILYVIGIGLYVVDLILDVNVCIRYALEGHMTEFYWTLAFLLIPMFINTAVSFTMYNQDNLQKNDPDYRYDDELSSKRKTMRVVMLILQLTMVQRMLDARRYAVKSRKEGKKEKWDLQRRYYVLMLKEDADLALLKIFECFLEAAPQQVLQTSILLKGSRNENLQVHQILSIISSILSMGWCLAAYQRAIRFVQEDKLNMNWVGSALQTVWHFLVSLSRVISISIIASLYPHWTIIACGIHIISMFLLVQIFDRSPFCADNKIGELAFSLALGAIYLFTYILPREGRTRYRYTGFYSLCFLENITCAAIWWFYNDTNIGLFYFYAVLVLSTVPYAVGLVCMVLYYKFLHPTLKQEATR